MGFQHGGMPELLIGLAYNDVTGRLSVQVIKGSNFKNMSMTRAPGALSIYGVSHTVYRRIVESRNENCWS